VIKVKVEEVESELGTLVYELSPGADTDAGSVPPELRAVGCLAEPEVATTELSEAVSMVEDRRVLAFLPAVITPHADVVILGKALREIAKLMHLSLLRTEDVWFFKADEITDEGTALRPAIASLSIVRIVVADIVAPYEEALCLDPEDRGEAEEQEE